jgi:hydroxysqualene synthase
MVASAELRSGKGHRDENFPVASHLIHPRHRPIILAFYEFVRVADDIVDHSQLSETEKLSRLDRLEASLLGESSSDSEGVRLRDALAQRGLPPKHAQDLLNAFRLDATKRRYKDWDDLIDYCRLSAMPVGRFVLDVHGEARDTWAANDALCAALQIINHLQDCAKDCRQLDRVYIPLAEFAAHGASVEALRAETASSELLNIIRGLASRTAGLLATSKGFSAQIHDARLSLEVAVIQQLAERLVALLQTRDPLSEKVHLGKYSVGANALAAVLKTAAKPRFALKLLSRKPRPT